MQAVVACFLLALLLAHDAQAAVAPDWKFSGLSAKDVPQMIIFTVRFC